jgi:hypothetical protein
MGKSFIVKLVSQHEPVLVAEDLDDPFLPIAYTSSR